MAKAVQTEKAEQRWQGPAGSVSGTRNAPLRSLCNLSSGTGCSWKDLGLTLQQFRATQGTTNTDRGHKGDVPGDH